MSPDLPPQPPRLSLVTVFWNGCEQVAPYFAALERVRAVLPLEVIAVDNASSDGTPDEIARTAPWAVLLRNPRNEGFAGGCNRGLQAATGTTLGLLNPDCEAEPDALLALLAHLEAHPEVGAVGPLLVHDDGLPQHSAYPEPSWRSYWATHSLASSLMQNLHKTRWRLGWRERRPRAVGWLMGACLLLRREAIAQVGLLEEDFFMYSEDTDWCRRLRDRGWRVEFLPAVQVLHHGGQSARKRREFTFRRIYRSLLLYSQRHHRPLENRLLRAAVWLDLTLRRPLYTLQGDRERLASLRTVLTMVRRNDPNLDPDTAPGPE